MIYIVKPEEISLESKQSRPVIQPHGINISVLETSQITQWSLQRNSVSDNLEINKGNFRKTWNLINELTSRHSGKTSNILEIKADNKIVKNQIQLI
mgnify:CR=1 FL=1